MVAATAEEHAEGVEGQEEHRDATEYVNFTKAISSIQAICIVSTVFHNIFKLLLSVLQIIRVVPVKINLDMLLVKSALDKLLVKAAQGKLLVKHHLVKHLGKTLVKHLV